MTREPDTKTTWWCEGCHKQIRCDDQQAFANNDECGDDDSWCDTCEPHTECYCTREEAIVMGMLEKYEAWVEILS